MISLCPATAPARGWSSADFIHRSAADEIKERLKDVNRTFTAPAIVTAHPEIWAEVLPGVACVPPEPVLTLEPGAHDLVIHAMALHWADDPVGQVVQCRRALASDGLFLAAAFGGETLHELRNALAEAEIAETGGLSPRVAPMAEVRQMGALLQRAGLALPVADAHRMTVSYGDIFALMHDLRAMGETNALIDRHRKPARKSCSPGHSAIYAGPLPRRRGPHPRDLRGHLSHRLGAAREPAETPPPRQRANAPRRGTERHTCPGQHRRRPLTGRTIEVSHR
jgi:SAM-dependent methyltransferase